MSPKSRLLIRPGAIGDCILSFPALQHLKADYTEVWISAPLVPLVQFADRVRAISSTQLDLVNLSEPAIPTTLAQRLSEFDEVFSWYGSNRPDFRARMPTWRFFQALPDAHSAHHAADFFLQQVGAPNGLIPQIQIDHPAQPRHTIAIHPFSGSPAKNWPLARYQHLASLLPLPVEWIVGPEDHPEAAALQPAPRFDNLMDLAKWLRGATAYLGNDSGISHLAAAIGLPSLVLFGPSQPNIWRPLGSHVSVLQHQPLNQLEVTNVLLKACALVQHRY